MTKAMDTNTEAKIFHMFRPFSDERSARREVRSIVPDRNFLHGEYIMSPLEWRELFYTEESRADFRRYIRVSMARNMGDLILEEKPDAFKEQQDFDKGQVFKADAVVFSPQEWREFEDKLVTLLTQTRVLRDN